VQSESQNCPMLRRLLGKESMMKQSSVPGGSCGSGTLALPMDVTISPFATVTCVGGSSLLNVVYGARLWK